jgi:signal transduction histidine kinase
MASNDPTNKPLKSGAAADRQAFAPRAEFAANDLLAVVSHDLMAPLTRVIALAARIKALDGGRLSDSATRECAEDILRSTAVMQQLLDDLQVGSAAAVTAQSDGRRQDISRLIAHVMDVFLPLATSASIQLTSDVPGSILVSCDAPRLFAALAHLIDVAMQFTAAGAFIRVSASCDGGECLISIVDNGAGIAASERPAGLAIARAIIDAHGGRLWIDSHAGIGSVFYFTLPLA